MKRSPRFADTLYSSGPYGGRQRAASNAEVILTGIQSPIAQTLVALGVDLGSLIPRSTLQEGICFAVQPGAQIASHDV